MKLFILASFVLSACSAPPVDYSPHEKTMLEVAHTIGMAYCTRLQACEKDKFDAKFPDGPSQCSAMIEDGVSMSDDPCTSEQVNRCTDDIDAETCADITAGTIAASCHLCE